MSRLRRSLRSAAKSAAQSTLHVSGRVQSKLRRPRLVVFYNHPVFARKSAAIVDLLRSRGLRAELRSLTALTRARLAASDDLWIGFWNKVPLEHLPKHYIFINAEPLNTPPRNDRVRNNGGNSEEWFAAMGNAQAVWGYARSDALHVEKLGVPFFFVPFGYAPFYEAEFQRNTESAPVHKDIDVLFCGGLSERRQRILRELQEKGMQVRIVTYANAAFGKELDSLLARSKIVLGIHYYDEEDNQIADLARLDYLLSNRIFVVHERPSALEADPVFERKVATCASSEIAETCQHFLARPEERATKATAAYEWFKTAYALDAFLPYDEIEEWLLRHAPFQSQRRQWAT